MVESTSSENSVFLDPNFENNTPKLQRVWFLVILINISQSFTLGFNYVVFNLPRKEVIVWIEKHLIVSSEIWVNRVNHDMHIVQFNDTYLPEEESLDAVKNYALLASCFAWGSLLGSGMLTFIANAKGAKFCLTSNSIFCIVNAILGFISVKYIEVDYLNTWDLTGSYPFLATVRFLSGINIGLTTPLIPMYFNDIGTMELRGVFVSSWVLAYKIGMLVVAILGMQTFMGGEDYWPFMLLIPAPFALLQLFLTPIIPESPVYLKKKGKNDKADDVIRKLYNGKLVNLDLQVPEPSALIDTNQTQDINVADQANSLTKYLFNPRYRNSILNFCACGILYIFNGVNEIMQYSTEIINNFGLSLQNSQMLSCAIFLLFVLISIPAIFLVNRWNRRPTVLFSTISAIFTSCSMAFIGHFQAIQTDIGQPPNKMLSILAVCLMCITIINFSLGLGNVVYVIPSEITPFQFRSMANSLNAVVIYFTSSLHLLCFPIIKKLLGNYIFFVFTGVNILGSLYIYFCLMESRNAKLDENFYENSGSKRRQNRTTSTKKLLASYE